MFTPTGIVQAVPPSGRNAVRYSEFYGLTAYNPGRDSVSLKFVLHGEETYCIDGQTHTLKAGRYLLFREGLPFETSLNNRQINRGLCVDLDPQLLAEAKAALLLPDPFSSPLQTNESLELEEGLFCGDDSLGETLGDVAMQAHHNGGRLGAADDFYAVLAERLVQSQLCIRQSTTNIAAKSPAVQKELYRRVALVRHYIHDNLSADLPLEELAAICPLSPFHFLRVFRQAFGATPHQYILTARLQKAKDLLQRADCLVKDVALDCGFSDIHCFSKAFKKRYGVAPSAVCK